MRYTEARLSKIAMEMLSDIGKDTVNFTPNFDETEKEPSVLPSRFPNLLVNGTTGIAVGMTTNIPPHNLREVISAVDRIIDNRIADKETVLDDILKIVKGPDFPTGAMILGSRGIKEAYKTGRGKVKVRGISSIEQMPNGKSRIIISELPYLVNKARLIEKIAELVKDKKIDGITDLRDESNREGMRIVIELRKDVNSNVILNRLYKHTQLQDTFGIIMLALVDNQPKILNLQQMLELYIKHQEDVISRRTAYDLKKAEERAHILEGLLKALDHIDEIIKIIRSSQNIAEAKEKLIERFEFSQIQAQAICEMRLRSLTGLERNRLENEYDELKIKIKLYKEILSDNKKLLGVIKEEINIIAGNFGDDRKTVFGQDDEFSDEDLIPVEDTVIAMTKLGYIKRMSPDNFKSQNRGGKGIKAMQTIEEDFIEDIIMTNTHKDINFFTNLGKVYRLKAYRIPEAGRTARGNSIVNLLKLDPGESVTAIIPNEENDRFKYFIMATRKGMVKKTHISEYENVRANGLTAIALNEDDELIEVKAANGDDHVVLVTKNAKCIVFHETEIRITGRKTLGVRGIRLSGDDVVIGMQMKTQGETLLVVSEYGMGKRTSLGEFRGTHRGNKGLACYKLTEKSGCLVGAKLVDDDREIFIITNEGILIRIEVSKISNIGRVTSGVKLMNIDRESGIKVAGIAKVRETNRDDEDEETGAAQNKE